MRVAQGLEPPDPNPEYSTARYFHDEAYLQLVNSKAMRGHYNEADAIAALHLVSFSLFSGGATNWRQVLSVAYEWVAQLGLPADENAQSKLMGMRPIEQMIVKTTMVSPKSPKSFRPYSPDYQGSSTLLVFFVPLLLPAGNNNYSHHILL